MKRNNIHLSILLPVRNEKENLPMTIGALDAILLNVPHEILIIYDVKNDNTIPAAKVLKKRYKQIQLIHNKKGRGVINAIKTGVEKAKGSYILTMAVDDAGPALIINEMVELMNQGCQFVSGTRYAHGGKRLGGSVIGGILSKIANKALHFLSGSLFTDTTTGLKMFRRDIFDQLSLESKPIGWAVVFEMAVKAQAINLKLGEVPFITIDRLYGGKSSFSLGPWVKEYLKWFFWGIKHLPKTKRKTIVKIRIPYSTALL